MNDLGAFNSRMEKEGNWIGGSGYGYGYPSGGRLLQSRTNAPDGVSAANKPAASRYMNARPGYEIHTLIASANILAQHGQQAQCEAVLDTARKLYGQYATALHHGNAHNVGINEWRSRQIADAQPVMSSKISYQSDELIGADIVDAQGKNLGSVDDIVLSPQDCLSGDWARGVLWNQ